MELFKIEEVLSKLDKQMEEKDQKDPWLVYVADKGENSCMQCVNNHGKRFRELDVKRPALPIHPNCKCKYEKLDEKTSKKVAMRSATVRTEESSGFGGIRVSTIGDMLTKLEKEYAPGTLAELIITGHGEFSGEFEIGGKSDRLDRMTPSQIERLQKLLSPNAIIDIRMCYGIQDENGEKVTQDLANKLQCRVRAYANQVSPYGTRPALPKNEHIPFWERPFTGAGAKIFYPQK